VKEIVDEEKRII